MFMDAEKMTTKAYVKPVMKVVEVDVQALCDVNSPGDPDYGLDGKDPDVDDSGNHLFGHGLGVKSTSVFDIEW